MHVYNILDMTYFGYNYKTQISSNYKLQNTGHSSTSD